MRLSEIEELISWSWQFYKKHLIEILGLGSLVVIFGILPSNLIFDFLFTLFFIWSVASLIILVKLRDENINFFEAFRLSIHKIIPLFFILILLGLISEFIFIFPSLLLLIIGHFIFKFLPYSIASKFPFSSIAITAIIVSQIFPAIFILFIFPFLSCVVILEDFEGMKVFYRTQQLLAGKEKDVLKRISFLLIIMLSIGLVLSFLAARISLFRDILDALILFYIYLSFFFLSIYEVFIYEELKYIKRNIPFEMPQKSIQTLWHILLIGGLSLIIVPVVVLLILVLLQKF